MTMTDLLVFLAALSLCVLFLVFVVYVFALYHRLSSKRYHERVAHIRFCDEISSFCSVRVLRCQRGSL